MPHRYFTGANQFGGAFEIVIAEAGHIRLDHQIGGATPKMAHHVLRDGEGLSDDVKKIPRRAIFGPLTFQVHSQHTLRAHVAQRARGHGIREHAIDQPPSANIYRQKHSWIRATGAHRIDD